MDPVGVFKHASDVINFISFVTWLLDSNHDILDEIPSAGGANGAHPDTVTHPSEETLEGIFSSLVTHGMDLDIGIQGFARQVQRQDDLKDIREHTAAFYDLSASCKDDCELLTEALCEVREQLLRPSHWPNFRYLIRDQLSDHEASALKCRLQEAWEALTRHVITLTG